VARLTAAVHVSASRALDRLRERGLRNRRLVKAAQFAVTGERMPRRVPLLAGSLRQGKHDFVLDLGCGSAPLLDFVSPQRYVGIDEHGPSLDEARRAHGGAGREFVLSPLSAVDLERWRGADAVVVSSVTHHLDDDGTVALLERVARDVAPVRILLQDAEAMGPLGPLVSYLDDGDHLRSRASLETLLAPGFETRCLWTYDNPLRSFHQFLLELRPRIAGSRSD
jgi:SAM-dependent methyltransferase